MTPEEEKRRERLFDAVETALRHNDRKQDVDVLMSLLRLHFADPSCMFRVSSFLLEGLGVHPHDALLLSKIPELRRCLRMEGFSPRPQLGRLSLAAEYLLAKATGLKLERFFLLCLDAQGRLKACCVIHEGTENGALFNLRRLMAEVLRVEPAAVVFAHNHPRRTLRPSQEDVECTLLGMHALAPLKTPVLDHLILAGKDAVSIRDNGFIPASAWLEQAPENRLLRGWLSEDDPFCADEAQKRQ